jgi:23S rRNA G2445 N2-methylase RlmL/tRNA G37 N-methylase Trm5
MLQFWALTSKGVEEVLASELTSLGATVSKVSLGAVRFEATLEQGYQICLWSRLATRIMRQLDQLAINEQSDVYAVANELDWTTQMDLRQSLAVECVGKHATIDNSQFGAMRVKDAIVDQFRAKFGERPDVSRLEPDVRFQLRMERQHFYFLKDFSGPSLHQRGYRKEQGEAPLKEQLAAALLIRSGWQFQQPLVDPFCGSGTLLIEAVLMARQLAPGLKRLKFAFENDSDFDTNLYQELRAKALGQRQALAPTSKFIGFDTDPRQLDKARQNAARAGVAEFIEFKSGDATTLEAAGTQIPGVVICNPPYGERLGDIPSLIPVYSEFSVRLKQHYANWRLAIITSNSDLLRSLKLSKLKSYKFANGPLDCEFTLFDLTEKQVQITSKTPSMFFAESESFANRLKKNVKQLEKWAKREQISCYRLYDADIPEYNVAVDWYDGEVVIHEYAAPSNVDEQIAQKRLFDIVTLVPQVLQVPTDAIVLKVREKQKGKEQYQALAKAGQYKTVSEYGAKFLVNLRDYLDTGLFLDHRVTRRSIQQQAKDKAVLNLFAYTGSASVHAALGGARSVTTVDMSNTYLDWAKRNFAINDLAGKQYQFVQANVLEWLADCKNQFELIFVDPPTFSNSKRMEDTWDVQRDHVKLLTMISKLVAPNGKVIFSNNKRKFKIAREELEAAGWLIKDISAASLPEDFKRNPQIHVCFELTRSA